MGKSATIESYMTKQRRNLEIVLEGLDFTWGEEELQKLARMNNEGFSIREMNEVFDRDDPDEIFLALFYLAKSGKVTQLNLKQLVRGLERVSQTNRKYNKLVLSEREYYRFKKKYDG
jgi:hypothetical protein